MIVFNDDNGAILQVEQDNPPILIVHDSLPGPAGPANTSTITLIGHEVNLDSFKTVIDDSFTPVFITTRSKPGSPQYTHTIGTSDIPVSPDIQDYMCLITIGGRNTDVSDDNLNWRVTKNGVDIGGSDESSAAIAGLYWTFLGVVCAVPIVAGDVIGVKLWTDVSNLINFAYATLYVVPQTLAIPVGLQSISPGTGYTQGVIAGAVGGITYLGSAQGGPGFYDRALDIVVTGFGTSGISTYGNLVQVISPMPTYKTDTSNYVNDVDAAPILERIRAGSFIKIIHNYPFLVGSPTFTGTPLYFDLSTTNTVNGTDGTDGNPIFNLPQTPLDPTQIDVVNQVQQVQGVNYDYSVVATIPRITFRSGSIPLTGDHPIIIFFY